MLRFLSFLVVIVVVVCDNDCMIWYNECDGRHQCDPLNNTVSLDCHVKIPEHIAPPLPGHCVFVNNSCQFVNPCVSWNKGCHIINYQCTNTSVYHQYLNTTGSQCSTQPSLAPDKRCLLINDTCQWYDDCTVWSNTCNNDYTCGNKTEHYKVTNGPQPMFPCHDTSTPALSPPGACIYQQDSCVWSECKSFLNPCMYSWRCDSYYEYLVAQSAPPPPCPAPPKGFTPPIEPGVCSYNITEQSCEYRPNNTNIDNCSITKCTGNNTRCINTHNGTSCLQSCFINNGGCNNDTICICGDDDCSILQCNNKHNGDCPIGMEYTECGSHCNSCDGLHLSCPAVCVAGCFCPKGLVKYRDRCVNKLECPSLLSNPPLIDPLPLDEDTVLISLLVTNATIQSFKSYYSQLTRNITLLLSAQEVESPSVSIYGAVNNTNYNINIVVMITSNDISNGVTNGNELIGIIKNGLTVTQFNITVQSQVYSKYSYSAGNSISTVDLILLIILPDVAFLLLIVSVIVIIVLIIVVVVKRRRWHRNTRSSCHDANESKYVTLQDDKE